MQKENYSILYSASDLIVFMSDRFSSWMDRRFLEDPDCPPPDTPEASLAIIQKHGIRHEEDLLKELEGEGADIKVVSTKDRGLALAETLAAMKAGRQIIYQAYLRHDKFAGYADFLVRSEGPSALGNYHYEVWDSKLARKTKPYFLVQLSCYAEMLEQIQGLLPRHVAVILGSKERKRLLLSDYYYFYQEVKKQFLQFQADFSLEKEPELLSIWEQSRWKGYALQVAEKQESLINIAGIRKSQIQKLKEHGIESMPDLASAADRLSISGISAKTLETLKSQARLQMQSRNKAIPVYEILADQNPEKGLSSLPPASEKDVYFDMEGYPLIEGGLEYLFGAETADLEFHDWWAHTRAEEKQAFSSFLSWLYERFLQDPQMHVYHYGSYEVSALRRLASRHAILERELDELLRAEVFIDLYAITRNSIRLGCDSYSIKSMELLYLGKRQGEVSKAVDSIVFYEEWLESQDGMSWQDSRMLAEIRNYNRLDCKSTHLLLNWLRERQLEAGLNYKAKDYENKRPVQKPQKANEKLAEELLARAESDHNLSSEERRIFELYGHLLCFHQREAKVSWWEFFDRAAMSDEELYADPNCIAFARLSSKVADCTSKGSLLFEYYFEASQDLKLKEGDSVSCSSEIADMARIEKLDPDSGLLILKRSARYGQVPEQAHWFLMEIARYQILEDAIAGQAQKLLENIPLPACISDLLARRLPRLEGRQTGSYICPEKNLSLASFTDAIASLSQSYLCVQGPPGTGKTYYSARAILALASQGKRVGISSNSHKAIENLLDELGKAALEAGIEIEAAKIGSDSTGATLRFSNPNIRQFKKLPSQAKLDKIQVLAATAWVFARSEFSGSFDYLFIDEAGQVSLANMLAMAAAAKNIVLVGDQLQLEQPVKGSHPGESGLSSLEYLLAESATIKPERGIFLSKSRRMHPHLCSLVSSAVYEGRLKADPRTEERKLIVSSTLNHLGKTSGLLYLPVEHTGNTQSSEEELCMIEKVIEDLLGCKFKEAKDTQERSFSLDDLIVLAPFNQQVRLIKRRLGQLRVGSVDLFQGQEAPVAIISMAASDLSSCPRGMEFLLSKKRLNVAISRAQVLAIVLANPNLVNFAANTLEQAELLNFFCRMMQEGQAASLKQSTCETQACLITEAGS